MFFCDSRLRLQQINWLSLLVKLTLKAKL
uniref:Uncharacterized protein n=1 Tax=Anguilla anguilla TaxID=7936 RepID=A0A0E9QV99_ANGAN